MNALELIGHIANIIGFMGGISATVLWWRTRRDDDQITIILGDGARTHIVPGILRRRDATRAEIMGRLGNARADGRRIGIPFVYTPAFLSTIDQVRQGQHNVVLITVSADQYDQFTAPT
jgi:hypothetical protein